MADSVLPGSVENDISHAEAKRAWRFRRLPPYWIVAVVLFGISLALDLYRLGVPSIWFDEAFSVELARQPLPLLWQITFGPEPNMELYYLFLHYWLALTGFLGLNPTEFVVRLPSAFFAAFSTVVVFALGRRFLGMMTGLAGTLLYLLNYLQLYYDLQTRAYGLQLLLTCLSWYALLMAFSTEKHTRLWWVLYVVVTVLAVYAHLFSVLIVCAQVCAVVGMLLLPGQWRGLVRKQFVPLVISWLMTGILSIPMLLVSLQGAKTGWLPSPHFHDLINFFYNLSGYSKYYLLAIVGCCVLGVIMVALARFPAVWLTNLASSEARAHQGWLSLAWALLCWFIVPVVVSYVVSQGATRLFSARYLVAVVPPLALLAGLGIAAWRGRVVQIVLALIVIGIALTVVPFYYRSVQVEDWNVGVQWVEQHYQTGDGLVCYDNTVNGGVKQGCQISVEYYLHAYPSPARFSPDSPGSFSWETYSAPNPDAAVDPAALSAYAAKHAHIFLIVGRVRDDAAEQRLEAAQQWLASHYHLKSRIETPTVRVWLFDTSQ